MNSLRILLVDDDDDDRLFFAKALESLEMNIELFHVTNGKACLEFLADHKNEKVNLIFLDLNMPVMNGFQCLEKIKQNKEYQDIVIAIYSTSSSEKDIDKTFDKGANIYINKPSSFEELKVSLRQVIKTNWTYKTNDLNREHFLLKI